MKRLVLGGRCVLSPSPVFCLPEIFYHGKFEIWVRLLRLSPSTLTNMETPRGP
jgi:hypothetical protein